MSRSLSLVKYRGFSNTFGEVYYVIIDRDVYFSGVTPANKVTSTINAAESIIKILAEEAGCPARFLTFYDIQTWRGYPGLYQGGSFEISRLVVEYEEGPHVQNWIPCAMSEDRIGHNGIRDTSQLPGVTQEVMDMFRHLIER